jgi:inositol 1,4,5-triphosphate receptor type 1
MKLGDLANEQAECRATRMLVQAAYNLLETYSVGESRKNELYLARHLSFFHQQLHSETKANRMLTELIRDNKKVVDVISDTETDLYVSLLEKSRDPDFFDLFLVLCSVEGVADGKNQSKLTQRLLVDRKDLVLRTTLDQQTGEVVVHRPQQGDIHLSQLANNALNDPTSVDARDFRFLEKQLDLFCELCLQRCDVAISVIASSYMTWEQLFTCVQNRRLPFSLRRMYVDLMINLFVDVGSNVDILDGIALVFEWDKLHANPFAESANDPTQSLSGARFQQFPQLSRWIIATLSANDGQVIAAEKEMNMFLESVLHLTHRLVEFGYFIAPQDIFALVDPVMKILNGTNDLPSIDESSSRRGTVSQGKSRRTRPQVELVGMADEPDPVAEYRASKRKEESAINEKVYCVKKAALEVMDTLINLSITVRLHQFLYDFKQVVEFRGDRRHTRQTRSGQPLKPTDLLEGPTLTLEQMQALKALAALEPVDATRFTKVMREYVDEVIDRSNYINPGWRPENARHRSADSSDFAEIMLDLAQYEYSMLVCKALQLLNRVFSSADDLFKNVVRAQVHELSLALAAHLSRPSPRSLDLPCRFTLCTP